MNGKLESEGSNDNPRLCVMLSEPDRQSLLIGWVEAVYSDIPERRMANY